MTANFDVCLGIINTTNLLLENCQCIPNYSHFCSLRFHIRVGTDCIWDLMDNAWCKGLNPKSRRRKAMYSSVCFIVVCFYLWGRVGVQWAGRGELSAETLVRFRTRGKRERADGRLPAPRGAAEVCGGKWGVAEGKEPEWRVKSGGVGGRRLWVAVEGRRKCCLIERGLDRGVTPGTLET